MPHAAGLWYEWHGPEEGEVLILSPGLGGSGAYWAPNLAAFAERYRVLLYDHRGTGRSDRALPEHHRVDEMAQDVLALMEALSIGEAHFVGHALGGMIGLALALIAPERIRKLVVVNGWAKLDPYTARCFDVRLTLLRDSGLDAYLRAQPIFLYPAGWISANLARLDAHAAVLSVACGGAEALENRIEAARAFDISDRLGEVAAPVLVVGARDDMLVPSHAAEALADGLPNASLGMPDFGGHACNVTYPDNFNAFTLAWLAGEMP
jgi:aminoacrylate hydrolase